MHIEITILSDVKSFSLKTNKLEKKREFLNDCKGTKEKSLKNKLAFLFQENESYKLNYRMN